MNDPAGEPHYRPPNAVLEAAPARRRVGVLRAVLAALGGFVLDVFGTNLIGAVLIYAFHALVPAGEFPAMDFADWARSLQSPWAVGDLAVSSAMSVLGGYVAARLAFGRAGLAFGVLAFLHLYYSLLPGVPVLQTGFMIVLDGLDPGVFAQIMVLNWGSTLLGMWLCRRDNRRASPSSSPSSSRDDAGDAA